MIEALLLLQIYRSLVIGSNKNRLETISNTLRSDRLNLVRTNYYCKTLKHVQLKMMPHNSTNIIRKRSYPRMGLLPYFASYDFHLLLIANLISWQTSSGKTVVHISSSGP